MINANYRAANKLIAVSDPDGGANFQFDPPSPDGFYASDMAVNVTALSRPGYKFRRWDGDLSGTFRSGTVSMVVPRVVTAQFDRVPFIAPAGIKNAAGDTPVDGVAPVPSSPSTAQALQRVSKLVLRTRSPSRWPAFWFFWETG